VGTATFAILRPERDRMRPQHATIRVLIAAGAVLRARIGDAACSVN
jgi:hypothetical protein